MFENLFVRKDVYIKQPPFRIRFRDNIAKLIVYFR